jgi:hypothetical protein
MSASSQRNRFLTAARVRLHVAFSFPEYEKGNR